MERETMLKILISLMLGPFGVKVQEWYIEHSLVVNSFIVGYGILLLVSYINYKRILDYALSDVKENKKKLETFKSPNLWKSAINKASFFPLISGSVSLIPRKTDPEEIYKLTEKDKRWNKIIEEMKSPNQSN
jgi:hypothetical protein